MFCFGEGPFRGERAFGHFGDDVDLALDFDEGDLEREAFKHGHGEGVYVALRGWGGDGGVEELGGHPACGALRGQGHRSGLCCGIFSNFGHAKVTYDGLALCE